MAQRNQEEFWSEVIEEREKIAKSLVAGEIAGQPRYLPDQRRGSMKGGVRRYEDHNVCFITSVKNRDRGTIEGSMVLATVQLAGQRVVEQTHRLSTDDEIVQYEEAQAKMREEIRQREGNRKAIEFAQKMFGNNASTN